MSFESLKVYCSLASADRPAKWSVCPTWEGLFRRTKGQLLMHYGRPSPSKRNKLGKYWCGVGGSISVAKKNFYWGLYLTLRRRQTKGEGGSKARKSLHYSLLREAVKKHICLWSGCEG